ncbi:hypothetical protein [Psychroserpens algicola]|uniref:hypothetical protein n=1 Tax=Psychroserpens algicola TaxID=1719034 RepID=UPI001952F33B|nr:hypothetical protein [Psychroserpens algicola]
MTLFLKKFGILFLGFICLATALSFGSLWALRQSSFYKPSFLANAVDESKFDYVILGASNGLTTLNTKVIDSVLAIDGINLSMDDTAVSSQYLMLQHFLAEGKQTKYCILASSPSSFDFKRNAINDNDYRFLMYANRSYVSDYYKQFSGKRASLLYHSKWMPTLGVSYYNAELFFPSMMSLVRPNKRNRFDEKGNYTYPVFQIEDELITDIEEMPIAFSNAYVKKIKGLCDANGITLICYISPIKTKYATINSVPFNVINHSNGLNNMKYFHDEIHVNTLGREASSLNFANDFEAYIKPSE